MTPTATQIEYLKQHPEAAEEFDAAFGAGASQQALAAPAAEPQRDVFDYAADAGKGALRGAANAVNETVDLIDSGTKALGETFGDIRYTPGAGIEVLSPAEVRARNNPRSITQLVTGETPAEEPLFKARIPTGDAPETMPGQIAETIAQFTAGMIGASKLIRLKQLANMGKAGAATVAAVRGAAADFTVFDPHQERLSNFIAENVPALRDSWVTYLAADADDGELEGRFKNAAEGLGLGIAFDGLLKAAKLSRAWIRGDGKAFDAAVDHVPAKVEDAGTIPVSAEITEGIPAAPPKPAIDPLPAPLSKAELDAVIDEAAARDPVASIEPFRLEKFAETPAAAARLISGVADRLREAPTVPLSETLERAEALAADLSVNPERMLAEISTSGEPGELAAQIVARQKALDIYARRSSDVFERFMSSAASRTELDVSLQQLAVVTEAARSARAEAGRTLGALRGQQSASAELLAKAQRLTDQQVTDLRERWLSVTDPEARRRMLLQALSDETGGEKALRLFRNALLSGPATHAINAASNAYKLGSLHAEEWLAGMYRGDKQQRSAAAHGFFSTAAGLGDAIKAGAKVFSSARPILDSIDDAAESITSAQSHAKNLADIYAGVERGDLAAAHLAAAKTLAVSWPTRLLGASDEVFKQLAYRGRVRGNAYAEGVASGLTGNELGRFVDEKLANSLDTATGRALDEDALEFARATTFTEKLDNSTVIRTLGRKVQSVTTGRDPVTLALNVPFVFVRTPTLVLDDFWQRSPLNLALWSDLNHADVAIKARARARMTMGASYTAMGLTLAASGNITGGGPADPELRKLWLQDHQPYSIRVGDGWYSYARFDPTGTHLGVIADAADIIEHVPQSDAEDVAKMLSAMFARQFQNKTFLRGASDLFGAITDAYGMKQERWIRNLAGSTIPAVFNAMKGDPYTREVRSFVDALRARLPGYSTHLDPMRNALGEPVIGSEIGGWSPIQRRTAKGDAVASALFDAFDKAGAGLDKPGVIDSGLDLSSYKRDRPDLGRRQSAYDRMGELMAASAVRPTLEALVTSPAWKILPPELQVAAARDAIGQFRLQAKAQMLAEYPEITQDRIKAQTKVFEALGAFPQE